jgi:hypothetical protein
MEGAKREVSRQFMHAFPNVDNVVTVPDRPFPL